MKDQTSHTPTEEWLIDITLKNNLFSFNLMEVLQYRDLLFLFVKRNVTTVYKQTNLGPLSSEITNLIRFGIQLPLLIGFFVCYYFIGASIKPNFYIVLFPFFVVLMGLFGLGLGMIISSMVTKYKDVKNLMNFGVQLLMYLSAVIYPIALIQEKFPKYAWLVEYKPMAHVIDTERFMILGQETFSIYGILYTTLITIVVLFLRVLLFNKAEKSFIDTI